MNPNANSFSFNSSAGNFVPRGGAPGQGQQQQPGYDQQGAYQQQGQGYGAPPGGAGYYQQYQQQSPYGQPQGGPPGGNYYQQYNQQPQQQYYGGYQQQQPQQAYRPPQHRNAPPSTEAPIVPASAAPSANLSSEAGAGVQDNWDDEEPVAPAPTPRAPVQGKTISLGAPKPAATPAAAEQPKAASTISISIGGKKVQEPKAEEPKAKETPAPAASTSSAAKSATSTPSKASPSATPAPAASSSSSSSAAKKPAAAKETPAAGVKTADEIAEQINSVAAEDELKDLFGAEGKDGKEHINVVFIGHVDAGKSTMGGQILVQSGMVVSALTLDDL